MRFDLFAETRNPRQVGSLRHNKDEKQEIKIGVECGIVVDGYSDFKVSTAVARNRGGGLPSGGVYPCFRITFEDCASFKVSTLTATALRQMPGRLPGNCLPEISNLTQVRICWLAVYRGTSPMRKCPPPWTPLGP